MRFDRFRVFFPEQTHPPGLFNPTLQRFAAVDDVIDWNVLAPRIGAIFDLAGNGRTLLKFNYGQDRFGPGTNLGPNANPNSPDWWQHYSWSDLNKDGVWERGEEGRLIDSRGGVELESLDPELHLPLLTEVAASVERELFANVGIRTGIVWRGERQHYLRQNPNRPFEAFSVPVTVSEIQAPMAVSAPQTMGLHFRVTSSCRNSCAHRQSTLFATCQTPTASTGRGISRQPGASAGAGRWCAGFAHTWNYDQASAYSGQSVRQNTYALTPNDLINAGKDGRYEFRTWSAKIYGTYEGPWDLRITPYIRHQSGHPFGRTFVARLNYGNVRILAEPIGHSTHGRHHTCSMCVSRKASDLAEAVASQRSSTASTC